MADTEDDVAVDQKPQQPDTPSSPAPKDAPPPGPSAFNQGPWADPFANIGAPPAIDYNKAVAAKRDVTDQEIGAVNAITGRNAADNQRLGAAAEAKNREIQSFNPQQLGTWDAKAKMAEYSTDPFKAFGSFAMVASLGMAAFTRAPLTASLNAMAGVMTGIKEGNDQAYDRDYAAWKDNTNVLLKRFDVMKSQLSSDMEVWKTKGEMGKVDLSNTMLKYGLYKDKAMLDAGLDDVVAQKWAATVKAMEGISDARVKIETQHAVVQAIEGENASRVKNGLPPMSPQEILEFKADAQQARTPEQRAFAATWKSYLDSPEGLKATPQERSEFYNKLKYNQNSSKAASTVDTLYKQKIEEFTQTNGRAPSADEATEILHDIKYKGESESALRKSSLYDQLKAEAVAANGGRPLSASQEKQVQDSVDRKALPAAARDKLASNITHAQKSEEVIDKLEGIMAQHGMIAGAGGQVRRPFEVLGNVTGVWPATDRAQFEQYMNILRQWEPRLLTESHGRPLAAEEKKVQQIVPGLELGATTQNTVDRLRNLKALIRQLRDDWTKRYEGTWAPPAAGAAAAPSSSAGKPLWQTGTPVQQ